MSHTQRMSHSVWDCKYHVVWIPKYPRKVLYGRIRQHLGEAIRESARQRERQILGGHLCSDSCPRVYLGPAEICGCSGRRVHKGQERNTNCQDKAVNGTLPEKTSGHGEI